ncbi:DNA-binding response regulator [Fulvitalea axinellae]|uniref:DNA-binding response regulator n=1 Tax=Fulvitalea axinellae TaxID=1182444 RepID=A0AAU9CX30_9BACT|nr:DNA-binding response regulator [Fulvitalea axinellae]
MKTIVIDDERLARKELISLLEAHPIVDVVAEAVNAEDARNKIDEIKPDLIFLDVQMPGETGFELLETLDFFPKVVFVTAYDEFAIKAFEVNAFDYLLKPVHPERLAETVKKLEAEFSEEREAKGQEPESAGGSQRGPLSVHDQVFVKDGDRCWFVRLEKVRLFESDGNYVKVYFDKNRPMIHRSLNALDEKLDDKHFFRASRKHIINLSWVEKIEPWFNGGLLVELKGGEKIEVSRRQAARFKEMMSL